MSLYYSKYGQHLYDDKNSNNKDCISVISQLNFNYVHSNVKPNSFKRAVHLPVFKKQHCRQIYHLLPGMYNLLLLI